ncbi:MAG: hypothetical protein KGM43_06205 [Planctomycetota bacterium]|nr:hypothetical protein [Planctomycetota bacterium]
MAVFHVVVTRHITVERFVVESADIYVESNTPHEAEQKVIRASESGSLDDLAAWYEISSDDQCDESDISIDVSVDPTPVNAKPDIFDEHS